jgi:hypothetical protein
MKDLEMSKLGEFKTKCVKQFIAQMKKWLNNWELKQEFLVNLRNEFAIENENMHREINEMMEESICQNNDESLHKGLRAIN